MYGVAQAGVRHRQRRQRRQQRNGVRNETMLYQLALVMSHSDEL